MEKKTVNAYPQKILLGGARVSVNHEASMGLDAKRNERDIADKYGHHQEVLLRPR